MNNVSVYLDKILKKHNYLQTNIINYEKIVDKDVKINNQKYNILGNDDILEIFYEIIDAAKMLDISVEDLKLFWSNIKEAFDALMDQINIPCEIKQAIKNHIDKTYHSINEYKNLKVMQDKQEKVRDDQTTKTSFLNNYVDNPLLEEFVDNIMILNTYWRMIIVAYMNNIYNIYYPFNPYSYLQEKHKRKRYKYKKNNKSSEDDENTEYAIKAVSRSMFAK